MMPPLNGMLRGYDQRISLLGWIECDELSWTERLAVNGATHFHCVFVVAGFEVEVERDGRNINDGYVHEPMTGMEGHGLPTVCAPHVRPDVTGTTRLFPEFAVRIKHGPPGFKVYVCCPVHLGNLFGG